MARSVRKPYYMWSRGVASQHVERTRAARAYRRLLRQVLMTVDPEDVSLPAREEAVGNNRGMWSGEGAPVYGPHFPEFRRK